MKAKKILAASLTCFALLVSLMVATTAPASAATTCKFPNVCWTNLVRSNSSSYTQTLRYNLYNGIVKGSARSVTVKAYFGKTTSAQTYLKYYTVRYNGPGECIYMQTYYGQGGKVRTGGTGFAKYVCPGATVKYTVNRTYKYSPPNHEYVRVTVREDTNYTQIWSFTR